MDKILEKKIRIKSGRRQSQRMVERVAERSRCWRFIPTWRNQGHTTYDPCFERSWCMSLLPACVHRPFQHTVRKQDCYVNDSRHGAYLILGVARLDPTSARSSSMLTVNVELSKDRFRTARQVSSTGSIRNCCGYELSKKDITDSHLNESSLYQSWLRLVRGFLPQASGSRIPRVTIVNPDTCPTVDNA